MYSGLSTSDESDRNILLDPLGWLNDHTIAAAQALLKLLVPIYLTSTSENSPTKRRHYHLSKNIVSGRQHSLVSTVLLGTTFTKGGQYSLVNSVL